MYIRRISKDARLTRRGHVVCGALLLFVLLILGAQMTSLAPLPHDRDDTLAGIACGVAFGFWFFSRPARREG